MEVEEELSTTGEDSGTLGRHLKGLGDIFQGGSAIGAFIWVMKPRMGQALGSFQYSITMKIMGRQPKQHKDGRCE